VKKAESGIAEKQKRGGDEKSVSTGGGGRDRNGTAQRTIPTLQAVLPAHGGPVAPLHPRRGRRYRFATAVHGFGQRRDGGR